MMAYKRSISGNFLKTSLVTSLRCCLRMSGRSRSVVEGIEINLPAATAIPLGFVVSELIANAAKYGNGRIAIKLEPNPEHGYALSVSNNGPALPEGFDASASKGLGMRIIQSFTRQIGGELRIGRGNDNQGARFSVLFPGMLEREEIAKKGDAPVGGSD